MVNVKFRVGYYGLFMAKKSLLESLLRKILLAFGSSQVRAPFSFILRKFNAKSY